ncbi:hypothetical protein F4802DRAFT_592562 [Xylaria palmicola]|nr:hypothetical protein F4802DRAFT_592562 [Xylaria palmicola]
MVTAQTPKRRREENPSCDSTPRKRRKPVCQRQLSNFPPEFYDRLPTISLTRRALRELDRRNRAQPPAQSVKPEEIDAVAVQSLASFAKRGGPDLQDLRGYSGPRHNPMLAKDASEASRATQDTQSLDKTSSNSRTSHRSKSRKSSAYDANFERHLINNNIHLPDYDSPKPANFDSILQDLSKSRGSLSPARTDDAVFQTFREWNKTVSEGTVMRKVVPLLAGDSLIPNDGHLPFTNAASLTDGTTANPTPDFFDGAAPSDLHRIVRRHLSELIEPSKHGSVPVVPNFFLEAKAPRAGSDVLARQACLDGAYGARAMHCLQNYQGGERSTYDGNAYTISAAYHSGFGLLQLYAHHISAPIGDGRPEYYMTPLKEYLLRSDCNTFISGTAALRNARDLAMRYRNEFITRANQVVLSNQERLNIVANADADVLVPLDVPKQAVQAEDPLIACPSTRDKDFRDTSPGTLPLSHAGPSTTSVTSITSSTERNGSKRSRQDRSSSNSVDSPPRRRPPKA